MTLKLLLLACTVAASRIRIVRRDPTVTIVLALIVFLCLGLVRCCRAACCPKPKVAQGTPIYQAGYNANYGATAVGPQANYGGTAVGPQVFYERPPNGLCYPSHVTPQVAKVNGRRSCW